MIETYISSLPAPSHSLPAAQELFVPGADLEELRSWYIANRDWLGQGTRLILAAKSLRVRLLACFLPSLPPSLPPSFLYSQCWSSGLFYASNPPSLPPSLPPSIIKQCSWLKDFAESKAWLDTLRVYRTVEVSVTCHLQQVRAPSLPPSPLFLLSFLSCRSFSYYSLRPSLPPSLPPSFLQGMREAEFRLSQNLGNLNILTVGGNTPAEKACMWITLKVGR